MKTPKEICYDYAMKLALTPYKWRGDDFSGVDCSGFVILFLQAAGVFPYKHDETAAQLAARYKATPYSALNPFEFGTLFFYGTPDIVHVTLALNGFQMISAEGGGRDTLTKEDAEIKNAFVKILPIAARGVPRLMARPGYPW